MPPTDISTVLSMEGNKRSGKDAFVSDGGRVRSSGKPKADDHEALASDLWLWRLSAVASMDDTYVHEILKRNDADSDALPSGFVRRTQSCGCHGRLTFAHRVRIQYHDEKIRERYERNARELLQAAFNDDSADSMTAILARKALRYRRILQRIENDHIDVHDPAFDASAILGVEWHYVERD